MLHKKHRQSLGQKVPVIEFCKRNLSFKKLFSKQEISPKQALKKCCLPKVVGNVILRFREMGGAQRVLLGV